MKSSANRQNGDIFLPAHMPDVYDATVTSIHKFVNSL